MPQEKDVFIVDVIWKKSFFRFRDVSMDVFQVENKTNNIMINFDSEYFNMGKVKWRDKSSYEITVTNNYNSPISIKAPTASCSCTTAYLKINPIPPKGTSSLVVTFDSSKVGLGSHTKKVTLSWIAPDKKANSKSLNYSVDVTK